MAAFCILHPVKIGNLSSTMSLAHILIGLHGAKCNLPFHRIYLQLFFLEGVNKRMQLQILAPAELFLRQLKGYSFLTRAEFLFFMIYSFRAL